jgi:hypothetical protein
VRDHRAYCAVGSRRAESGAPLPVKPTFKREFIDFEHGIRMGRLEPNERITQIVKAHLVAREQERLQVSFPFRASEATKRKEL